MTGSSDREMAPGCVIPAKKEKYAIDNGIYI